MYKHNKKYKNGKIFSLSRDFIKLFIRHSHIHSFVLILSRGHFFHRILERQDEEERGRNIDVRGKHGLVASAKLPNRGSNPKPRYMPELGIKSTTFRCMERHSSQLSHTSHGHPLLVVKCKSWKKHTNIHSSEAHSYTIDCLF